MYIKPTGFLIILLSVILCSCNTCTDELQVELKQPVIPVLALKENNPVLQVRLVRANPVDYRLEEVKLSLTGTSNLSDVVSVSLYLSGEDGMFSPESRIGIVEKAAEEVSFKTDLPVSQDTFIFWASVKLKDSVNLLGRVNATCTKIGTSVGNVNIPARQPSEGLRVGIALRQSMQDGVKSYRIPGLTTSTKGTLLAICDARRESDRDLQGDIDIVLNRSTDGGQSWSPMQIVLDMGQWGGLPERFNGVSDACILSDENTGTLYIIGLWMYGVLDSQNGKWIEGLKDSSTEWNHQWREFGSQPGYDVKRSSQVLISTSTDDGLTWSKPENITRQVKKEEWWLLAPAPGHGITLSDGTILFPSEGRDKDGERFSTITWSKDGGKTWVTGNPACTNTNECMAVELSDHSVMLNMRERSNRGLMEGNGRAVAVTGDLGKTWSVHPTSRKALIESACMAAIHRHTYSENGKKKSVLFFSNPNSKTIRNNFTIKTSFDDGNSWPESNWLLLDEYSGNGYSCITSVGEETIGVLYEGSQADIVFQLIPVSELINK